MIIKKSGRDLYAEFVCKICNCEYSAALKECDVVPCFDYSTIPDECEMRNLRSAIASLTCPCCGFKENICSMKYFKEYTEYPKDNESNDLESVGTVETN